MSLPSGYKRLEYIKSSGSQFIDTGFIPNQDTRIDIDAIPLSIAETSDGAGFIPYGAGVSNSNRAFECYSSMSQYEFNYDGQYNFVGSPAVGQRLKISHNKNKISLIVNSGTPIAFSFTYQAFTAPYTMTLFAIHRSSPLRGLMKLYSCQIYDNGTLIRDYIPCQTTAGEIGLWDDVNSVFYGNAGTGTFTAGPVVAVIPDAPSNLQQTMSIRLIWAEVSGAEQYNVYRDNTLLGTTTGLFYVDDTAAENTEYTYAVSAVNSAGESPKTTITVYTKSGYFLYKPYIESATFQ